LIAGLLISDLFGSLALSSDFEIELSGFIHPGDY
jgi:hypothetical protein